MISIVSESKVLGMDFRPKELKLCLGLNHTDRGRDRDR